MDKTNIVINLSEYTAPVIQEYYNRDWVEYRVKNDKKYDYPTGYYHYLIDRAKYSVTNGGAIGGFCKFIYGEGLEAKDARFKPTEWVNLMQMLSSKDLKKAINDRKKLMMAALQVTKEKGEVTKITHFPVKTLLPEKMNDDGEIEAWYYHPNWEEKKSNEEPTRIPSFGFGGDSGNEIYIVQDYNSGSDYFGSDDGYTGALAYAVLEEEIADFQVNDAQNGFTPTTILNFNNGVKDEETRRLVQRDIERKTTGATGKKVIVSFNDDETKRTTVEKVAMDNAPEHYQYLSEECVDKILAGHRAPAEVLGFNKNATGFSNNAEELKNKLKAFVHYEVQPFQMEFIDAISDIIAVNGISLNLYFKSLEPEDFKEDEETVSNTALSIHDKTDFTDEEGETLLEGLEGEVIDGEWTLVDVRDCKEDNVSTEEWVKGLIPEKKQTLAEKFKGMLAVVKSKPSDTSVLDEDIYKIRYSYRERYSSGKSRSFCRQMMNRTDRGVVYRYEDISQASFRGVNRSQGHRGQPYSLFKYKGGVNCGHYWQEEFYRLKKKTDGDFYQDRSLASSEEVKSIPKENYRGDNVDNETAFESPKDMPRNGHHPNYRA